MKESKAGLLFVLITSAFAIGQVIDFESLDDEGLVGNIYFGSSYSEDGFELTTTEEFAYTTLYGSASLVLHSGPDIGTVTITQENGEIFDMVSMDFASGSSQNLTLIGTRIDNSTIEELISLEGNWLIDSYTLTNLTDIVSVGWEDRDFVFDNITIVPEPATLLLFAFGSVLARKRTSKA